MNEPLLNFVIESKRAGLKLYYNACCARSKREITLITNIYYCSPIIVCCDSINPPLGLELSSPLVLIVDVRCYALLIFARMLPRIIFSSDRLNMGGITERECYLCVPNVT